jgi:hypothetical protein
MKFSDLVGKTIINVEGSPYAGGSLIKFSVSDIGMSSDKKLHTLYMYHEQSCCESVYIKDIVGDWRDIIGSKVLLAEERSNSGYQHDDDPDDEYYGLDGSTETWTFYELNTSSGSMTISWYGSSNGYYSERVEFSEHPPYMYDEE